MLTNLLQLEMVTAAPNCTMTQIIIKKENKPSRQGPSRHAPIHPNRTTIITMMPATTHAIGAEVNAFTARPLSNLGRLDKMAGVILKNVFENGTFEPEFGRY